MRSLARFPDENPNPVMRLAQDGKILYANAASAPLLRLLGRQVGQNLPESWVAQVGTVHASALPNDLEAVAEGRVFSCMLTPIAGTGYVNLYGRDITARKAAEAELHRHGDSLEHLVKERTAALEANNAHLATEIMERRRTEQALQRSETQLEEAMELARLVNWEYDVATGTFTFNDRFYALFGTTAQREGGYLMPAEVYSREFVHPQDAHLVAAEIAVIVRATDPHYVSKMEHRILRRDGEVRYIAVSAGTTRDATGRIVTTHGANQDITERKRAEEKLRILQRAVEQSPATVAITNAQGTIEYVNPKFVETTGYAREEAIGQNPRVLQSGTQSRAFYAELWSTIRAGNVWHGEFCNKKNGELYFESAAIAPIRDERGQITHFVAIKEDITEQRRIADELRKAKDAAETANQAKSDFLANMSHELRTPLSAIIGFSELLEEKLFGDLNPKQEEYVRDILESGRHLLSLINDILDLAKIEAGKTELESSSFPLATLLDNSLVMVKEKCLKHGIRLPWTFRNRSATW